MQNLKPLTTEAQKHRENQKRFPGFPLACAQRAGRLCLCAFVVSGFFHGFSLCSSCSLWLKNLLPFSVLSVVNPIQAPQ
jgi:hypothetical protein